MSEASTAAIERHYTPAEIAKAWQVSPRTVQRLFEREPGVLVIGNGRRRRRTLRVPATVLERVQRRLSRGR